MLAPSDPAAPNLVSTSTAAQTGKVDTDAMETEEKLFDQGAEPSFARSLPKDLTIEKKVGGHDFAMRHLLNLVQLRIAFKANAISLGWMCLWTVPKAMPSEPHKNVESSEMFRDLAELKRTHHIFFKAGKTRIIEDILRDVKDLGIEGGRATRWATLLQFVTRAGRPWRGVFQIRRHKDT